MSQKIIQIHLNNVTDVMRSVGHFSLESGISIFQAERELFISKSTSSVDEDSFVWIHRQNIDLVVTRKSINKRKYLTPSIIVDKLVNEGSRIVIFRTCAIDVMIINTNPNSSLLFGHKENVRYPVYWWDRINKPCLEKLFNFSFDGRSFSQVHGA